VLQQTERCAGPERLCAHGAAERRLDAVNSFVDTGVPDDASYHTNHVDVRIISTRCQMAFEEKQLLLFDRRAGVSAVTHLLF